MHQELSHFAARLRETISAGPPAFDDRQFSDLARELFALQYQFNPVYRRLCEAKSVTPATVADWTNVPAVPAGAFKELELTCIPVAEQTAAFHSSGTTGQKSSRHFHCRESLALYETSLWHWFKPHFQPGNELLFLTPDSAAAPHSSLVHMFETVAQAGGAVNRGAFCGRLDEDGAWTVDFDRAIQRLQSASAHRRPLTVLGTAFSFVHLLDHLAANGQRFALADGSQVMETGGYKNRSRELPKTELHALITRYLGVKRSDIICEYGMSELSSQAYDAPRLHGPGNGSGSMPSPSAAANAGAPVNRYFRFSPWARARMISPETGREAAQDEPGLIHIFDLANVFSVAALQTEDLGIQRADGFELIGRAGQAESRGCSLMSA